METEPVCVSCRSSGKLEFQVFPHVSAAGVMMDGTTEHSDQKIFGILTFRVRDDCFRLWHAGTGDYIRKFIFRTADHGKKLGSQQDRTCLGFVGPEEVFAADTRGVHIFNAVTGQPRRKIDLAAMIPHGDALSAVSSCGRFFMTMPDLPPEEKNHAGEYRTRLYAMNNCLVDALARPTCIHEFSAFYMSSDLLSVQSLVKISASHDGNTAVLLYPRKSAAADLPGSRYCIRVLRRKADHFRVVAEGTAPRPADSVAVSAGGTFCIVGSVGNAAVLRCDDLQPVLKLDTVTAKVTDIIVSPETGDILSFHPTSAGGYIVKAPTDRIAPALAASVPGLESAYMEKASQNLKKTIRAATPELLAGLYCTAGLREPELVRAIQRNSEAAAIVVRDFPKLADSRMTLRAAGMQTVAPGRER